MTKLITRIAPDVGWLPISFANVYFIGRPGGKWIVVDSGLPGRAQTIIEAAEARFGAGSRPEAIVLTHGHADHVGSALALAKGWDVSVYAHRLEMPYLAGKSPYPPADPTVGGAIAFLSRFFPSHSHDLGEHVRQLQPGKVPGSNRMEMDRNAGTFSRAHFVVPTVGPRAPGGRCVCDHEYGFMERSAYRQANTGARGFAFYDGLGGDAIVGARISEPASQCRGMRTRNSDVRRGLAGANGSVRGKIPRAAARTLCSATRQDGREWNRRSSAGAI